MPLQLVIMWIHFLHPSHLLPNIIFVVSAICFVFFKGLLDKAFYYTISSGFFNIIV